jgi:hypothetical protein
MNRDLTHQNTAEETSPDRPPFAGSWRRLYALVLGELVLLILLFYLFRKAFE